MDWFFFYLLNFFNHQPPQVCNTSPLCRLTWSSDTLDRDGPTQPPQANSQLWKQRSLGHKPDVDQYVPGPTKVIYVCTLGWVSPSGHGTEQTPIPRSQTLLPLLPLLTHTNTPDPKMPPMTETLLQSWTTSTCLGQKWTPLPPQTQYRIHYRTPRIPHRPTPISFPQDKHPATHTTNPKDNNYITIVYIGYIKSTCQNVLTPSVNVIKDEKHFHKHKPEVISHKW